MRIQEEIEELIEELEISSDEWLLKDIEDSKKDFPSHFSASPSER